MRYACCFKLYCAYFHDPVLLVIQSCGFRVEGYKKNVFDAFRIWQPGVNRGRPRWVSGNGDQRQ